MWLLLNIIVLLFLLLFLFAWLSKVLSGSLQKKQIRLKEKEKELNGLSRENESIAGHNLALSKQADETIAMYDLTKEICRYLDEDKVVLAFKEQLGKYVKFDECKFIKNEAGLGQKSGYRILPVKISSEASPFGFLIVGGIEDSEKEKFDILAHQFILGIKKAFLYKQVQEMAITDTLTGVFTRRYFLERLKEEFDRSRKFEHCFSFLMLDIDCFKEYNDRFGHLVGDMILKEVTKTIKENIRQIDIMGRYGGEEFAICLTETGKSEATIIAERIREAVGTRNIPAYDEELRVTISIGIASFPADSVELEPLIENADRALYRAKESGRNKVCI